jgi:hypothetical protein
LSAVVGHLEPFYRQSQFITSQINRSRQYHREPLPVKSCYWFEIVLRIQLSDIIATEFGTRFLRGVIPRLDSGGLETGGDKRLVVLRWLVGSVTLIVVVVIVVLASS